MEEYNNKTERNNLILIVGVLILVTFGLGYWIGNIQKPALFKTRLVDCSVLTDGGLNIKFLTNTLDSDIETLEYNGTKSIDVNGKTYQVNCKYW